MLQKFTTKDKIMESLKNPITLSLVKRRLNEIAILPTEGNSVVCGQAVASAIFEILKLDIEPIFNDIDLFIEISHDTYQTMILDTDISTRESKTSSWGEIGIEYDYAEIFAHKSITYNILHSSSFGMLNKTYISNVHKLDHFGIISSSDMVLEVIKNFDINSTQVGFSVMSNELVFTNDFIEFILSKQLKIVNWNTPAHSLIRLHKKFKEFKTVYVDFEESKMLCMVVLSSHKNSYDLVKSAFEFSSSEKNISQINSIKYQFSDISGLPLFFGKKYQDLFSTYIEDSDIQLFSKELYRGKQFDLKLKHHSVNKFSSNLSTYLPDNSGKYFDQFLDKVSSSHFVQLNKVHSKAFQETLHNIFYERTDIGFNEAVINNNLNSLVDNNYSMSTLVEYLPQSYNSIMKTKKKSIYFFNSLVNSSNDSTPFNKISGTVLGILSSVNFIGIDVINNNFIDQSKKFNSFFSNHNVSHVFERIQFNNWIEVINNLKFVIRSHEFGDSFYGLLENTKIPTSILLDRVKLAKVLDNLISSDSEELTPSNINYIGESFSIKELTSKNELVIEGSEMNHCVGGYSSSVRSGYSKIISVSDKLEGRFTVELSPLNSQNISSDSNKKFEINQIQRRFNKSASWNSSVKYLIEINKVYPIFPISGRTFEIIFLRNPSSEAIAQANELCAEGIYVLPPETEAKLFLESPQEFQNHYQAPVRLPNDNVVEQGNIPYVDIDTEEIPF